MDHRKTPAGKALTLPGWVIIGCALFCLGAAIYLGTLLLGGNDSGSDTPSASVTKTAPTTAAPTTPVPTSPAQTSSAPTSSPPSSEPTETPPGRTRNVPVAVFNNTRTSGLARTVAAKVTAAGWTVSSTGNWHGLIPEDTVYYPPGFQNQAELLAKDLDVGRVRPSVAPMKSDRLTFILSGQQ